MTSMLELHADGLSTLTRVARDLGGDLDKQWRAALRDAARPIARDAQARYRQLSPLGARAARTVRAKASLRGVEVTAGGKPWSKAQEFGTKRRATRRHNVNDAFGRGFSLPGVVKRIDYVAIYGSFTKGGRALYPAAKEGRADAVRRLEKLRDEALSRFAAAGGGA